MKLISFKRKAFLFTLSALWLTAIINKTAAQQLQVNDSAYFEKPGVNVMVFGSEYNGMFFDEKTAGIEKSKTIQYGIL